MKKKPKVWLKTEPCRPRAVRWVPHSYDFEARKGLSLAKVYESDVGALLRHKSGCCGRKKHIFFRATREEIERWKGTLMLR